MRKFVIALLLGFTLLGTGCATGAKSVDGSTTWASTKVVTVDTPNGEVTCILVFEVAGTEPHGIDCDW
jgi:hypothetical protein